MPPSIERLTMFEKRDTILYAMIKKANKKHLQKEAKIAGTTLSHIVDALISQHREKQNKRKKK